MYGETFYGRHTAQHQLQWSQIKIRNEILKEQWKQAVKRMLNLLQIIVVCIKKRTIGLVIRKEKQP